MGETAVDGCSDDEELCALGLVLPGNRFFLSLFGCRGSASLVGDLWNRLCSFRSLDGVTTSGVCTGTGTGIGADAGPSSLSSLLPASPASVAKTLVAIIAAGEMAKSD